MFLITRCGYMHGVGRSSVVGIFLFYFVGLYYTEHTLCLALGSGSGGMLSQTMCERFRSLH